MYKFSAKKIVRNPETGDVVRIEIPIFHFNTIEAVKGILDSVLESEEISEVRIVKR